MAVMTPKAGIREVTLDMIISAQLTPMEHLLLTGFVSEAVDSEYAARYVSRRVNDNPGRKVEEILQDLKRDWKQLVTKCEFSFPFSIHGIAGLPPVHWFLDKMKCHQKRKVLSSTEMPALLHGITPK
jgi:hypothetical protein